MLNLKFIRENLDLVKKAVDDKNIKFDFDLFLEIDNKRRKFISKIDELKHKKNVASLKIIELKKENKNIDDLIKEMQNVAIETDRYENELREIENEFFKLLSWLPNIPHNSTPEGKGQEDNIKVKEWSDLPKFDFTPLTHWELGERLDILDFKRASKISGSNFVLYKGLGAKLERALINFMLDLHTKKHKYIEIFPPFLVNRKSMFNTGQLPKLEEDMYRIETEDFFPIPTAEVPVTNIYSDEILNEESLPIYLTAYSACFRKEAGSYGKDTKGLLRIHQFNKVEMVKFTKPEDSYDELELLLQNAEEVLQLLNLHYRVISLCKGELSFAASKCYDIEVYAPGQQKYLEVSSCSNFEDFQARRANIRFRNKTTKSLEFVHTLNGSGIATPRTFIALIETYQQKDGSIKIPEVLQSYIDNLREIK